MNNIQCAAIGRIVPPSEGVFLDEGREIRAPSSVLTG